MSKIPTGRKVAYPPLIDFSPNDPPDPSFLPVLNLEDEVVSSVFPAETLHFFQRENEHDGATELCCRFVLETRAELDGTYRQEVRAYLLKRLVQSLNAYAAKALMEDLGITFDEFREVLRKLRWGDTTLAAYGFDGFYSELDTLRAHRDRSEKKIAELRRCVESLCFTYEIPVPEEDEES